MADIDIISRPDEECFYPAYNCVDFCFKSNNYQVSAGTKAVFTIEKDADISGYGPGVPMVIAGQEYETGTANTHNTVNTAPLQNALDFATNFKEALESNAYIYNNFIITIVSDVMIATAREVGVIEDFTFDYSDPAFGSNAPVTTETQGTAAEFLENYKVAVEVWECENGTPTKKINQQAYSVDSEGEFCIDLGKNLSYLLETAIACYESRVLLSLWQGDPLISKRFCLRYGEIYSDDLSQCNVSARTMFTSNPFTLVNAAFQQEEYQDKFNMICDTKWMSSMPQYAELCERTYMHLWINIEDIMLSISGDPNLEAYPFYVFTYTDGTTEEAVSLVFEENEVLAANGFVYVSVGLPIIGVLLNPAKKLHSWECRIVVRDTSLPIPTGDTYYGSKFFKLVDCCDSTVDFCFLNEFGGYDAILMQSIDTVQINSDFSVFDSFLDCSDEAQIERGKDIIANSNYEVFTVTSDFVDNYNNRKWLRQAIISPRKFACFMVAGEEQFSKVIVLDTSIIYQNEKDNTLRLVIQFRLSKDLITQKI